jgi:hypothetical protein
MKDLVTMNTHVKYESFITIPLEVMVKVKISEERKT